jgi:AhpD family alkylhydroperoxidase
MALDNHTAALVAVGASIPANCQPCLQACVTKALQSGADPQEIQNAIDIGKKVRAGAASKMDTFALGLKVSTVGSVAQGQATCSCGS